MVLFLCVIITLSSAQVPRWTNQRCGIDNQKIYDRTLGLGIDTCNDYCRSPLVIADSGSCVLNNGYGECLCVITSMIGAPL